jgi:predicted DNA-binding transcriptional regulator AlpA
VIDTRPLNGDYRKEKLRRYRRRQGRLNPPAAPAEVMPPPVVEVAPVDVPSAPRLEVPPPPVVVTVQSLGPALLDSRQVAGLLAASVKTVWRLVERGVIPAPIRFNRKLVRWHPADIAAALERLRTAG